MATPESTLRVMSEYIITRIFTSKHMQKDTQCGHKTEYAKHAQCGHKIDTVTATCVVDKSLSWPEGDVVLDWNIRTLAE